MTTIAWDGATLAADRNVNGEDCRVAEMVKIRRGADGRLVGCAGLATQVPGVLDALAKGRRPRAWGEGTEALEVRPDGSVWLHDMHGAARFASPFAAIGSGACFALAALACGRDAAQAVLVAAQFDHATGDVLDVMTLEAPPRPPPRRAPARGRRRTPARA